MTPVDYALTIPTAYTREELEFFWDKLNECGPLSIVEVGVEYGCTASLLFHYAADNSRFPLNVEIELIDSYIQHPELSLPSLCNNIILNPKFKGVDFSLHRRPSITLGMKGGERVDFLHIDASHSYDDTKHELSFAVTGRDGTWVILHDFDRKGPNGEDIYEGVGRAAREHFKREPDEIVGTCALYRS